MRHQNLDISRLVQIRIESGEDILTGIEKAVEAESIQTGVILNGLGSASAYHFHVVSSCDLPPEEIDPKGTGPFDIVAMAGAVIDGRVHAHITFTDDKIAFGGHLEPGCKALTFCMITLADVGEAKLTNWDQISG
jgi:predicted DNA-binding protein with PD1-like motif